MGVFFGVKETKRQRDKETKRGRDKERKRQREEETKRGRNEVIKRNKPFNGSTMNSPPTPPYYGSVAAALHLMNSQIRCK